MTLDEAGAGRVLFLFPGMSPFSFLLIKKILIFSSYLTCEQQHKSRPLLVISLFPRKRPLPTFVRNLSTARTTKHTNSAGGATESFKVMKRIRKVSLPYRYIRLFRTYFLLEISIGRIPSLPLQHSKPLYLQFESQISGVSLVQGAYRIIFYLFLCLYLALILHCSSVLL